MSSPSSDDVQFLQSTPLFSQALKLKIFNFKLTYAYLYSDGYR